VNDQCTTCDNIATLVETGTSALEDIGATLGTPTPTLHRHLINHSRKDLMERLTYGDEPMLEPAEVPAVDGDTAAIDGPVFVDVPEQDPDATWIGETIAPHLSEYLDHEDQGVAEAASEAVAWVRILIERVVAFNGREDLRAELATLEARRAEILAALGETEAPEPQEEPEPQPDRDWPAIREWAAQRGLDCPSRGRVPRAVVDAYDARWSA